MTFDRIPKREVPIEQAVWYQFDEAAERLFLHTGERVIPFDPMPVVEMLPVTLPAWQDEWEDIHSQQFVRSVW